jgi:hypothetical protein
MLTLGAVALSWLVVGLLLGIILGPLCSFNNPPKSIRDEVDRGI